MKGVLTTLILGAALAEFGLTGLQHEDGSSYQPAEQATAVYDQIVPIRMSKRVFTSSIAASVKFLGMRSRLPNPLSSMVLPRLPTRIQK